MALFAVASQFPQTPPNALRLLLITMTMLTLDSVQVTFTQLTTLLSTLCKNVITSAQQLWQIRVFFWEALQTYAVIVDLEIPELV